MNDELKDKIIFALKMYAFTTRTEDLEKLGYTVKARRTNNGVTKKFYHEGNEVAVMKWDNHNNYTVTYNYYTPIEFVYALAALKG